ncbi:MAG: cytochrome c oxidase assembly protein [Actinomycetota bacterium]
MQPSIAWGGWSTWHAHPDVWVLMLSLLGGYFLALRVVRAPLDASESERATRRRKLFFVGGIAVLWIGADWPVHELSENYLFSVHMVQHTLFSLVAPPLLLLGLPPWLLRQLIRSPRVLKFARFVTRPVFALLAFNAVIAITHWPTLVDLSLRSEPVHLLIHTVLVTTALLMWFPVISPLPELARLSEPAKMLYLFLQSILPTVPASFLTFANAPIYHFYETVPRLWGISVVTDQMVAGLIMKILGGLLLWTAIAILFFRWHMAEQRAELETVSWPDFERELDAWELRR